MNCTGKRCIMQYDKVDPATCQCVSYCPQATPPKTNADRVRAMSDEELAKWLSCPGKKEDMFPNLEIYIAPNADEWLDWLKKEVEERE